MLGSSPARNREHFDVPRVGPVKILEDERDRLGSPPRRRTMSTTEANSHEAGQVVHRAAGATPAGGVRRAQPSRRQYTTAQGAHHLHPMAT